MTRADAEVRGAGMRHELADRSLAVLPAEALADQLLEVDTPQAQRAMDSTIESRRDQTCEFRLLPHVQAEGLDADLAVLQACRPVFVDVMKPVAQHLAVRAAVTGHVRSVRPVDYGHQRQRMSALVCMLRRSRDAPRKL